MVRSIAPVLLSIYKVLFHVFPPSVVLYTPRSSLAEYKCPKTATSTVLGSSGSITILPICCDSPKPLYCHVFPLSELLKIPTPAYDERLELFSPVPTQMVS